MDGKNPYEVPTEMRDFAEKSVDQARKAFDGFIGAAQKAVDSAHGSAESARVNVQDMTKKAMTYAEGNVSAAFDLANKLVKSRDMNEVLQHQSEFLKSQMASLQAQLKELGTTVQDVAKKTAETAAKATKLK
ncbi:phasin [Bosea vestrisii]|uniref:phasin n=1 Tax=Bosea vestrisii TaxID=151416 RepID=UPI0024DF48E7|nr:phasin [Bosea vestrisii]WID95649.1 phasin [Bosea vestrisii]